MESYYVVKKGYRTGIFKTWLECKSAVDGFKNPIFKKFNSFDEANTFLNTNNILNNNYSFSNNNQSSNTSNTSHTSHTSHTSQTNNEMMNKVTNDIKYIKSMEYSEIINYDVKNWTTINNEIYIFTDGSSRKSKEFLNSGLGVYLGKNVNNIKEQYNNKTNNQCELLSIDYAFKLIVRYFRELSEINKPIYLVSDSEYSLKACSVWLANWKQNNWKTSSGEDVKNKDIIQSIDSSISRIKLINTKLDNSNKIKIKFKHINSHQKPDFNDNTIYNIWLGNYIADLLAQNKL